MTRPRALALACISGVAILGFFEFPGHTWLQQDTQIWVPMLEHVWDPTALQKDLVAMKPHFAFTIYDEMAIALRWVTRSSFHAVLMVEQIAFRILELLGVYLLARAFGLQRRMAVFVAACFGLGATIIGPAVLTFEYEPVPRGFALGCLFLAIGLAARGRLLFAGCAAACGFLIHAPTAIPVVILLVVLAMRRRDYGGLIPLASAFMLLLIISRFQAGATETQPFFEKIDPDWERIERVRALYNWVSAWVNPLLWQYVLFAVLTMVGLWRIRPAGGRLFAIGLPIIGLLSVPASYVLTEKAKWALMPQVQPARAVLWITAMMVIVGAAAGIRAAERRVWWESLLWFVVVFAIPLGARIWGLSLPLWALGAALALLAWAAVATDRAVVLAAAIVVPIFAIPLVGHVRNYPELHTPELEALVGWARASTPKDATFLFADAGRSLDPGLFRAEAIRPVYVDWKAGGQVNYFRSLADEWWGRWSATMSGVDVGGNLGRFRALGIDYVVMGRRIDGLSPVYSNGRYLVYDAAR